MMDSAKSVQVQTQGQQMQQVQTLSPQQVMLVHMLECSTIEMEERVRSEVIDNPALEEGSDEIPTSDSSAEERDEGGHESTEELISGDYSSDDDVPDYKLYGVVQTPEQQAESIPYADSSSFNDLLIEQLHEQPLDERQTSIAEYLIGSLDNDGFLSKPLSSISDELAIYQNTEVSVKELEQLMHIIQTFDPAGIGASDLQECLLLQINRKKATPSVQLQRDIITHCYDMFRQKRWDKIAQKLNVANELVDQAIAELVKLNPRPGSALGESINKGMQQIIPDFIVENFDDQIILSLNNRNQPELRVSADFMQMLDEQSRSTNSESRNAARFLKQKIDSARDFIQAIRQREQTMMTTMQTIIDLQRPFFLEGDETLLHPMILKDVAERAHYDISTISRVTNNKYVQTAYGIYPLKFFFTDGIVRDDGEEVSIKELHQHLQTLVEEEDKSNPLTDEQLAKALSEKGFQVARRTVAKYREQLNIPVARLRH